MLKSSNLQLLKRYLISIVKLSFVNQNLIFGYSWSLIIFGFFIIWAQGFAHKGNTTNLIDCLIKDSSVLFFLIWVTNRFYKFTCSVFVFFKAFMQLYSYSFIAIFPIFEVTAGLLKLQIKLCYKCNYDESEILNRIL